MKMFFIKPLLGGLTFLVSSCASPQPVYVQLDTYPANVRFYDGYAMTAPCELFLAHAAHYLASRDNHAELDFVAEYKRVVHAADANLDYIITNEECDSFLNRFEKNHNPQR